MDDIKKKITELSGLQTGELRMRWQKYYRVEAPDHLSRDLLTRGISYKIQEDYQGGLSQSTKRQLRTLAQKLDTEDNTSFDLGPSLKSGAKLVREWRNRTHTVIVREDGYDYDGHRYRSLTQIAREITGARWSGPRFFGLNDKKHIRGWPKVRHVKTC